MSPPGFFAQIGGGLSVVFDSSLPAGSRITSLLVGCEPVRDGATYQIATNNFVAAGGDDYTMLVDATRVLLFGPALNEALADWLGANTPAGGSVRV